MSHELIKSQFRQNKASWIKSSFEGLSQDENCNFLPWMTYLAIEFLQKNINQNHEIFEFGCGASTLFFSPRVKLLVGLETRRGWLEFTQGKLTKNNTKLNLMEDGLVNENYEKFATNYGQKFDFIIIDSLKRFQCAINSIHALKPGGAIILDDSERKNYAKIFSFFESNGFRKQDFVGIAPGQLRVKNTTFFWKKS